MKKTVYFAVFLSLLTFVAGCSKKQEHIPPSSLKDIFEAAKIGVVQDVKYFVEGVGTDINAKDTNGWTPLHHAAVSNYSIGVLNYLIEKGAVVTKDTKGLTPIDLASSEEKKTILRGALTQQLVREQQVREQQAKEQLAKEQQERRRQEQEKNTSEGLPQEVLIGGAVVAGIALLILLIWAATRQSSKCPSCKQAWGKQIINTLLIDSRLDTRGSFETVYHYNSKGEVTGSTTIPTTKLVTVKTYENECRCKHCGYEWSYTHTTEN